MKIPYTVLALFLIGTSIAARAQCPRVAGIMVDACADGATEARNEFIFFLNGSSPLNVDDLQVILPANVNIGSGTSDFAPNVGQAPIGTCLTVLDDGDVIPANAPFIMFMSSDVATTYDFSSWCTQYGTVYLLYKTNPAPTTATFLNSGPAGTFRTVGVDVTGATGCNAEYTYEVLAGTSTDGNFYRFPEPTGGTSISPGFVNNGCASPPFQLLPVTLEGFTASYRNRGVMLNWATSMEINASHFEVQKSTDAINFSMIGTVNAVGNSGTVTRYSYIDSGPTDGRIYYRLRTVDIDGSEKFSRIITLKAGVNGITLNTLYPNPVTDELTVEWNGITNQKTQVSIRDLAGRLLQTSAVTTVPGFNQLRLNTSQLSSGQYFLSLDFENDRIVQVFLKR